MYVCVCALVLTFCAVIYAHSRGFVWSRARDLQLANGRARCVIVKRRESYREY